MWFLNCGNLFEVQFLNSNPSAGPKILGARAGSYQVTWYADSRKLKSNDKQAGAWPGPAAA